MKENNVITYRGRFKNCSSNHKSTRNIIFSGLWFTIKYLFFTILLSLLDFYSTFIHSLIPHTVHGSNNISQPGAKVGTCIPSNRCS